MPFKDHNVVRARHSPNSTRVPECCIVPCIPSHEHHHRATSDPEKISSGPRGVPIHLCELCTTTVTKYWDRRYSGVQTAMIRTSIAPLGYEVEDTRCIEAQHVSRAGIAHLPLKLRILSVPLISPNIGEDRNQGGRCYTCDAI
jgi:hypothetical protein